MRPQRELFSGCHADRKSSRLVLVSDIFMAKIEACEQMGK